MPERVIAAVPAMQSGFRPEVPDLFYRNNMKNWAPALCEKRQVKGKVAEPRNGRRSAILSPNCLSFNPMEWLCR